VKRQPRRFQKPGVTHQFVDTVPDVKLDPRTATQLISSRLDVDPPASTQAIFKSLFDTLSKPKQDANTFEAEMRLFKSVQLLNPIRAILPNRSQDQSPSSKDLMMALDCIKTSSITPDAGLLEDLLRICANHAAPTQAQQLLSRMGREFGVKATEKSKEILAYAHLKAGDSDAALQILSSLTTISNCTPLNVFRLTIYV